MVSARMKLRAQMQTRSRLTLQLLDGAAVLCGTLLASDEDYMKACGVEVLVLPADGTYENLVWSSPPPQPPLRLIYCKANSADEMVSVAGDAGTFHAGWSLSAIIETWTALVDAVQLHDSPHYKFLREVNEISDSAAAALLSC